MTYWLIEFDDRQGKGWLALDEEMVAVGLYDFDGNPMTGNVNYTTIDDSGNLIPAWAV